VLWFLAEDDENVPLVPSWIALRAAFAASPGEDETLVVIPDANHAFLVEEPDGGLHYARGFFERKRAWLAERGMSREGCFESPGRPGPG
jgi:pimeloyl-ACP methyl ester carboxylesterase